MSGIDKATKLLLHGDGADNGTTITDSSMFAKSISRYGNTCTKTGIKKLGTAALYFDGVGDYLTAADSDDWYFNTENFTIEGWMYFTELFTTVSYIHTLVAQYIDTNNYFRVGLRCASSTTWGIHCFSVSGGSTIFQILETETDYAINTWYHIALVRNGNDFCLYKNGALIGSTSSSSAIPNYSSVLYIGRYSSDSNAHKGYIDELRISKSIARWTSEFTPPTEPYSLSTAFCINPDTGNDEFAGIDWANAWKTIKYGASTIVPAGALVKIAKSPDPVSIGNATWTHKSATVTLASSLTQEIDNCESGWTASTNITITYDTSYRKQGSYGMKVVAGASFTTGKMAYKTLSSPLDLSSYQAISFWVRHNVAIASYGVKICLCSDTAGNTPVDTFYVVPSGKVEGSYWNARKIDKGSALGSSIQSVAIYVDSDPSTLTLYVDNIMACNDFSLLNLIAKKDSNSNYEAWYAIRSITGNDVILENATMGQYETPYGYYGTGGTVATYSRLPFIPTLADEYTVLSSGDSSNYITFSGGYNTSSDSVDGETYINGQGLQSNGFILNAQSYTKMYRINPVGCYLGLSITGAFNEFYAHCLGNHFSGAISVGGNNNLIDIDYVVNSNASYFLITTIGKANTFLIDYMLGANGAVNFDGGSRCSILRFILAANFSGQAAIYLTGGGHKVFSGTIKDHTGTTGTIYFYGAEGSNYLYDIVFQDNNVRNVYFGGNAGHHELVNCTFDLDPPASAFAAYYDTSVRLIKIAGDINANKFYSVQGTIESQTSVRHTASGIAWKVSPTSSTYVLQGMPIICPLARIAVAANAQVTVSAWFRRTNTGLTASLVCKERQLVGITSDVVSSMTADADTWQQLTIQFTPTEQGVVEIEAQCYGGTTYSMYIDDLTVSQA